MCDRSFPLSHSSLALIEGIWLGTVFSFQALCALGLIFVGSMVYASQEKQPNAVGLGYVMLNVILSVITPILEKRFVQVWIDNSFRLLLLLLLFYYALLILSISAPKNRTDAIRSCFIPQS